MKNEKIYGMLFSKVYALLIAKAEKKARTREEVDEITSWHLEGKKGTFNISELEDTPENRKKIFYKQKLIEGYDEERDITFDQTLIVTYSLKYKLYQQTVRNRQIERAKKYLEHPSESDRCSKTDAKTYHIL